MSPSSRQKAFTNHDISDALEILERERSSLFDLAMRMSAQVSRSVYAVDEALEWVLGETLHFSKKPEPQDLRIIAYQKLRETASDIWNENTELLENQGFLPRKKIPPEEQFLRKVDSSIHKLSSDHKECFLLYTRSKFTLEEISEITCQSHESVRSHVQQTLQLLRIELKSHLTGQEKSEADESIIHASSQLPLHPLPPRSHHTTQNLSLIMGELKASRGLASFFES